MQPNLHVSHQPRTTAVDTKQSVHRGAELGGEEVVTLHGPWFPSGTEHRRDLPIAIAHTSLLVPLPWNPPWVSAPLKQNSDHLRVLLVVRHQ